MVDFINLKAFANVLADQLRECLTGSTVNKRVYTRDEAAAYCGLTLDSFKKKVIRDRLRKVRFDKCWRFDKTDLDSWIDNYKEEVSQERVA